MNETTGKIIVENLEVAETMFARMKGLLGRTALAKGGALLIQPCKGIHTFGMRFPIDVIYLDKGNRVMATVQHMKPNRISRIYLSAKSVVELPVGSLECIPVATGDLIGFDET